MKFHDWINIGQVVTGLVGSLIKQHERPGHGDSKKQAVVEQVVGIVDVALAAIGEGSDLLRKPVIREMAEHAVDAQVELNNVTGDFEHSDSEPEQIPLFVSAVAKDEVKKGDVVVHATPPIEEKEIVVPKAPEVKMRSELPNTPSVRLMPVTLVSLATRYIGVKELTGNKDHPLIQWWMSLSGYGLEVHDEVPWCSGFLNGLAWELDLPRSKSAASRSWLRVGYDVVTLDQAVSGWDIVILKKPDGPDGSVLSAPGHVGIFMGMSDGSVHLLGGNQSNQVGIAKFPVSLVIGVRRLWA